MFNEGQQCTHERGLRNSLILKCKVHAFVSVFGLHICCALEKQLYPVLVQTMAWLYVTTGAPDMLQWNNRTRHFLWNQLKLYDISYIPICDICMGSHHVWNTEVPLYFDSIGWQLGATEKLLRIPFLWHHNNLCDLSDVSNTLAGCKSQQVPSFLWMLAVSYELMLPKQIP